MSDLSLARILISDKPLHAVASAIGDGIKTDFLFPNSPTVIGSVEVYVGGNLMASGYTYDNDTGLCIFTAAPADGAEIAIKGLYVLMPDADIQAVIDAEGSVKLGAAACLDIIASSQAMLQKKMTMLDFSIDGPALAKSLREHAQILRSQSDEDGAWDIADQVYDQYSLKEKIAKDIMREGL